MNNDDVLKQLAELNARINEMTESSRSSAGKVDPGQRVTFDADRASDPEYLGTFMQKTIDEMGTRLMERMDTQLKGVSETLTKQQQQIALRQNYANAFEEDPDFDSTPVVEGLSMTWGQLRKQAIESGNETDIKAYLDKRDSSKSAAQDAKRQKNIDDSDPAQTKGRSQDAGDKQPDTKALEKQREVLMRQAMAGDDEAAKKLRDMAKT